VAAPAQLVIKIAFGYTMHSARDESDSQSNHRMPSSFPSGQWSLTDVCGFSDILLAAHHKRTTTVLSLQ